MQTMIALGMLFVLGVAGCSATAGDLTGPDEEIHPSVDPGIKQPHFSCGATNPIGRTCLVLVR